MTTDVKTIFPENTGLRNLYWIVILPQMGKVKNKVFIT